MPGRTWHVIAAEFHLLLFIFYGSDGIRQIGHNIIFGWWFIPIMAISWDYFKNYPTINTIRGKIMKYLKENCRIVYYQG
jgi:hypothetical protein